jgi:hypothetical protein
MGKNRSASGLTNIIQYDDRGNIAFVSGSTTLMSVSSSGAITTTGVISGSNVQSASLALNSNLLQGTGSVGFTTTASFTATSGSASSRLTQIESVYATTGSNSFRATQSITGSLTVTGQIIAQTINVQQVTSSIVYSSGSNVFGCDINSRQTFTGSFYQTGSIAVFNSCVGIGTGTNSISNRLEVRGDVKINADVNNCRSLFFGIAGTNYGKIEYNDTNSSLLISTVGSGFSGYDLNLGTKDNIRFNISGNGVACFACQVCVPSMTALTPRTSGTDVNILTLADNVTGLQTSGFGVRILATSNNGQARSAIGFEADGGTNNDTAISFYTQTSAACLAHRMIIDKSGQVAIGSKSTVSGIKLLVCGGGDYNTLFTSDCNRSGWTIAQPGTSSPVASGLVLAGSCSFRFGTNSYYHIVMNQDGATQIFNTAGNATNTFMPSGLLCTLCGIRFGTGATTLNNYETGTWTPRFGDGSWLTNAGPDNSGWYIRIGSMVTVGGTLNWSGGSGSPANDLRIRCFPFAASNGTNERNVGQFGAPGAGSIGFRCGTNSQMVLVTDPGQSSAYVIEAYQSGTFLTYTHSPCVANTGIIYGFQITYHI